jgi:hypothetical protein
MSTEIELYSKLQNPIEAIDRIGEFFTSSGMFGCNNKSQGMVLAMACLAEKKSPFEIKRAYHLVDGELSMRTDHMLGRFRSIGGKHKIVSRTPEVASVELTLDGEKQTFSFSWVDAQKEPFVWSNSKNTKGEWLPKKNWATPRARMQMLWARVVSDGVRAMAPEIVSGTYTPEEVNDEPSAPVAPLLPEKPVAVQGTVIDVQPAADQRPTDNPTSGPQQKPEAEKTTTIAAALDPATGKLTADTVRALEFVIGESNAVRALDYLKGLGWIKTSLADLTAKRAQKILNNPAGFIASLPAS